MTYIVLIVATFLSGIVGVLVRKIISNIGSRIIEPVQNFDAVLILEKIIRKDFSGLSDSKKIIRNKLADYLGGGILGLLMLFLIKSTLITERPLYFFLSFFLISLAMTTLLRMFTKIGEPIWKIERRELIGRLFDIAVQSIFTVLAFLFIIQIILIFN